MIYFVFVGLNINEIKFTCLFWHLYYLFVKIVFISLTALNLHVACRLSLVVVNRGYSSLGRVDFLLWWLHLLHSVGSRHIGFNSCSSWDLEHDSIVVAHGLSCCMA